MAATDAVAAVIAASSAAVGGSPLPSRMSRMRPNVSAAGAATVDSSACGPCRSQQPSSRSIRTRCFGPSTTTAPVRGRCRHRLQLEHRSGGGSLRERNTTVRWTAVTPETARDGSQRSRSVLTRYSMLARVRAETVPQAWSLTRRSVEIERMASHKAHEVSLRPPSGGSTRTRNGIRCRSTVVNGTTTINPAGPLLNWSVEMIRAGRWRPCSCPRTGSKSANQISPRPAN